MPLPRHTLRLHDTWATVPAAGWDALVADASPFLEHAFLSALEGRCAGDWVPRPVVVEDPDGNVVAGAPGWVRETSRGEYVYDRHWQRALLEAGLPYAPRLVVGVPWTPVPGERLLVHREVERAPWLRALLHGIGGASVGCHSLHFHFVPDAELPDHAPTRSFSRTQVHYQWINRDYADEEAFLARFRSRDRKKIRRERREVDRFEIQVVHDPSPAIVVQLGEMWHANCARHDQEPWLESGFFEALAANWRHRIVAFLALDAGRIVAGTLSVRKGDTLYGRYWGTAEEHPFLHFEVCYHRSIGYAIAQQLRTFDPGYGGNHKFRRGCEPTLATSLHWFRNQRVHASLAQHAERERKRVAEALAELRAASPLRLTESDETGQGPNPSPR